MCQNTWAFGGKDDLLQFLDPNLVCFYTLRWQEGFGVGIGGWGKDTEMNALRKPLET